MKELNKSGSKNRFKFASLKQRKESLKIKSFTLEKEDLWFKAEFERLMDLDLSSGYTRVAKLIKNWVHSLETLLYFKNEITKALMWGLKDIVASYVGLEAFESDENELELTGKENVRESTISIVSLVTALVKDLQGEIYSEMLEFLSLLVKIAAHTTNTEDIKAIFESFDAIFKVHSKNLRQDIVSVLTIFDELFTKGDEYLLQWGGQVLGQLLRKASTDLVFEYYLLKIQGNCVTIHEELVEDESSEDEEIESLEETTHSKELKLRISWEKSAAMIFFQAFKQVDNGFYSQTEKIFTKMLHYYASPDKIAEFQKMNSQLVPKVEQMLEYLAVLMGHHGSAATLAPMFTILIDFYRKTKSVTAILLISVWTGLRKGSRIQGTIFVILDREQLLKFIILINDDMNSSSQIANERFLFLFMSFAAHANATELLSAHRIFQQVPMDSYQFAFFDMFYSAQPSLTGLYKQHPIDGLMGYCYVAQMIERGLKLELGPHSKFCQDFEKSLAQESYISLAIIASAPSYDINFESLWNLADKVFESKDSALLGKYLQVLVSKANSKNISQLQSIYEQVVNLLKRERASLGYLKGAKEYIAFLAANGNLQITKFEDILEIVGESMGSLYSDIRLQTVQILLQFLPPTSSDIRKV
jgi:hypothetical protein